jgi:hypothetical protein
MSKDDSKSLQLDSRTQALLRLQASRERIRRSMQPDHEGPVWHWLEHPWRFLRRWWRRIAPAVRAAGGWTRATPAPAHAAAGNDPAMPPASGGADQPSLKEAGAAALTSTRGWVREHPVASVAIAAVLGAVLIGKRGVLWDLVRGMGQGLMRQGQGWLLGRISDPALYLAIIAALAARPAAAAGAGAGQDEGPQPQEEAGAPRDRRGS